MRVRGCHSKLKGMRSRIMRNTALDLLRDQAQEVE